MDRCRRGSPFLFRAAGHHGNVLRRIETRRDWRRALVYASAAAAGNAAGVSRVEQDSTMGPNSRGVVRVAVVLCPDRYLSDQARALIRRLPDFTPDLAGITVLVLEPMGRDEYHAADGLSCESGGAMDICRSGGCFERNTRRAANDRIETSELENVRMTGDDKMVALAVFPR